MAFERTKRLLNNAISLDENAIIDTILIDKAFQAFIINLNTEEQLFKQGINALNVKLDTIGGGYSDATIIGTSNFEGKISKGQPTDRVTLKDTGEFYESFKITLNKDNFVISSDPMKDGTSLFQRWGKEIEGLTPENLQLVIDEIRKKMVPLVLLKLAA